jgi:hypothetical protein
MIFSGCLNDSAEDAIVTLHDLAASFVFHAREVKLDAENLYTCEDCNVALPLWREEVKVQHIGRQFIWRLNRTADGSSNRVRVLLADRVEIQGRSYWVKAVGVHSGAHWICYVRCAAAWVEYNDSCVRLFRCLPVSVEQHARILLLEVEATRNEVCSSSDWEAFTTFAQKIKLVGTRPDSSYLARVSSELQSRQLGFSKADCDKIGICLHSYFLSDYSWHTARWQGNLSGFEKCVPSCCIGPVTRLCEQRKPQLCKKFGTYSNAHARTRCSRSGKHVRSQLWRQ